MVLRYSLIASIATVTASLASLPATAIPLSPGDRIRIVIPVDQTLPETYRFSGVYEVNLDGTVQVPLIPPVQASGKELPQVQREISQSLLSGGFFRPEFLQVSVQIVDYGPVQVNVAGATFRPGRVLLSDRLQTEGDNNELQPDLARRQNDVTISGEYPEGRYLTSALRRAGGLKPTADIRNIRLMRGNQEQTIDISGALTGQGINDIPLIAGDRIVVPQLETIQAELVRPSQVTPSTVPVYITALQGSGGGQAGRIAQFEYGSRFSQAVVAGSCSGGSPSTTANRRVTLVQTDQLTGQTQVYDKEVEELLRNPVASGSNPFLMPGDSLVCYDSRVNNLSSILNFIGDILNPVRLLDDIFFD